MANQLFHFDNGKVKSIMWKRFFFEGNQYVGWIETPEDWKKLRKAYEGIMTVYDLVQAKNKPAPKDDGFSLQENPDKFGFYAEYHGDKTLKEFFEENGIEYID